MATRKEIYNNVPTDELKEKIIELKMMYDLKIPFDEKVLDIVPNVHPKQLTRICSTNFKYICVSRVGNKLTYYISVSRKEFKWYSASHNIIEAVKAVKKKFAEHRIKCESIRIY